MHGIREPLPLEDAIGLAEFAVMTGRVPHPAQWVDRFIAEAEDAALEGLF